MKIQAKVKRVGEVRTGTSKTTGKNWTIRDVLLNWTDEAGESYISASIDANLWAGQGIEVGDTIQVELHFYTKLLPSCKIANEIRIININ